MNHDSLTWPNHPVERTAPSGSFFPCVRRCLGAAAHWKRVCRACGHAWGCKSPVQVCVEPKDK